MHSTEDSDRSQPIRRERRSLSLDWSSLSQLERAALLGSALVWLGVLLLGAGLLLVVRNQALDRQAYAQATMMVAATSTVRALPTQTQVLYPAGWATATPTVPLPAPSTLTATRIAEATQPSAAALASSTPEAVAEAATTGDDAAVHVPSDPPGKPTAGAPARQVTQPSPVPSYGPPDRIVISSIDLDQPVVPIGLSTVEQGGTQYAVWDVADYAVSWHKTSAYPGQNGNIVLNGHNNIKGEVFRDLIDVEIGDRVLLYVDERVLVYEIEDKMIVKEKGEPPEVQRENAQWIGPTDHERLTMVTCWPYTSNTHRLIVIARPLGPLPDAGLQQ